MNEKYICFIIILFLLIIVYFIINKITTGYDFLYYTILAVVFFSIVGYLGMLLFTPIIEEIEEPPNIITKEVIDSPLSNILNNCNNIKVGQKQELI